MFDARTAKALAPGAHITIDDAPGLRLVATESTRTWVYRYKSPVDGRMRQIKIGAWPAMGYQAAWVAWQQLRETRDSGRDPAVEQRELKASAKAAAQAAAVLKREGPYTVERLCQDYVDRVLKHSRQEKGWREVQRTFATMLGDLAADLPQHVTRARAYDYLQQFVHIPVQAGSLRRELGGAWDFGIDSGRLPEETPNWWRQVMRGRLRTKGKTIAGEAAPIKRVLSPDELGEVINFLPALPRNVADVLTLYMWTLCRGAEIVAMRTEWLREIDGVLWCQIPKAFTKNARIEHATDLMVPLLGRARAVVERRREVTPNGFIFWSPRPKARQHIEQKAVQLSVWAFMPYSTTHPEHVRPRWPVTKWAPHDLRRSGRTLLASMGCPSDVGEALLGHLQPGIEGVYNLHTYDAQRLDWLGRLDDRLERLAAAARQPKKEKPAEAG